MDIKQRVVEVLEQIGLPYGYISKDEGPDQFIAYTISNNRGYKFFDDDEKITHYNITVNIFSKYDYTEIQDKLEELMLIAGFTKEYYPACIYIENMGIYNQPMYFNYFEEGEY